MSEKPKKRSCVHLEGEEIIPICYFCEKVVSEEDYCYGCGHYVCQDCIKDDCFGQGKHCVDDHQPPEEDEEW